MQLSGWCSGMRGRLLLVLRCVLRSVLLHGLLHMLLLMMMGELGRRRHGSLGHSHGRRKRSRWKRGAACEREGERRLKPVALRMGLGLVLTLAADAVRLVTRLRRRLGLMMLPIVGLHVIRLNGCRN